MNLKRFPVGLHSRGRVDCVPEETVTGHFQSYHTRDAGTYNEETVRDGGTISNSNPAYQSANLSAAEVARWADAGC